MGLSASVGHLLALTARKSDLEFDEITTSMERQAKFHQSANERADIQDNYKAQIDPLQDEIKEIREVIDKNSDQDKESSEINIETLTLEINELHGEINDLKNQEDRELDEQEERSKEYQDKLDRQISSDQTQIQDLQEEIKSVKDLVSQETEEFKYFQN